MTAPYGSSRITFDNKFRHLASRPASCKNRRPSQLPDTDHQPEPVNKQRCKSATLLRNVGFWRLVSRHNPNAIRRLCNAKFHPRPVAAEIAWSAGQIILLYMAIGKYDEKKRVDIGKDSFFNPVDMWHQAQNLSDRPSKIDHIPSVLNQSSSKSPVPPSSSSPVPFMYESKPNMSSKFDSIMGGLKVDISCLSPSP